MRRTAAFLWLSRVVQLGLVITCLWLGILCLGCHKQNADKPLPVSDIPQTIESAFKKADPEVSNVVQEVVTTVSADQVQALEDLQTLSSRPNLTPEQRKAADRSFYSVLSQVQQAADRGDAKAKEAMQKYRATK